VGFQQPEINLSHSTAEEIEAATAYVKRHAPDLLAILGLAEERPDHPEFAHEPKCSKGHEYTEENTIWRKDRYGNYTRRRCRECKNAYARSFASKGKPQ
jgi:hypothetical protein